MSGLDATRFYNAVGMVAMITGHPVKLWFKTLAEAHKFVDCSRGSNNCRRNMDVRRRANWVMITAPKRPK